MELPVEEKSSELIIGERGWSFAHPHFLTGLNSSQVYLPKQKMEALCLAHNELGEHLAPDHRCHCGIYARKISSKEEYRDSGYWFGDWDVTGQVALWGRVIEHRDGYRAQFAYPINLVVRKKNLEHLTEYIGYLYGVPVSFEVWTPPVVHEPDLGILYKEVKQKVIKPVKPKSEEQKLRELRAKLRQSLRGRKLTYQKWMDDLARQMEEINNVQRGIAELDEEIRNLGRSRRTKGILTTFNKSVQIELQDKLRSKRTKWGRSDE